MSDTFLVGKTDIKSALDMMEKEYWDRKIDAALAQPDPDPEDVKREEAIKDAFREMASHLS